MKRLLIVVGLVALAAAVVLAVFVLNRRPLRGETALAEAIARGDAAAVKNLIARGDDVNARDKGYTPLMFAARGGDPEVIGALLDARADPNARDCAAQGWTPLIHAIHKGQTAAARALVERGADVNAPAGSCTQELVEAGMTPLMYAAMYDNAEMVKFLLERGANPRATNEGANALSYAVGGAALGRLSDIDRAATHPCPTETVKALLARAPDLKVSDGALDRATSYILKKKCPEVAALLEGRRAEPAPSPAGGRTGAAHLR